jgi:hypothetical protein
MDKANNVIPAGTSVAEVGPGELSGLGGSVCLTEEAKDTTGLTVAKSLVLLEVTEIGLGMHEIGAVVLLLFPAKISLTGGLRIGACA